MKEQLQVPVKQPDGSIVEVPLGQTGYTIRKDWYWKYYWKHPDVKFNINVLRQQWIKEVGNKCAMCGEDKKLLFHHNNYNNLWGEKLYIDGVFVCNRCHAKFHDRGGKLTKWLWGDHKYVKPQSFDLNVFDKVQHGLSSIKEKKTQSCSFGLLFKKILK